MFDDLDDFLNGGPSVPTSLTVVDAIPINDHDSSLDLDLSLPSITKKRSKRTSPISKAKEEFVPAKGQKTAAARFNKLKKAIADLNSSDEVKPDKRTRNADTSKNGRQQRKTASGRPSRRVVVDCDDYNGSDSDSDGCSMARHANHHNNRNYDPNVISIDCDDGYYHGGNTQVQIERNLTAAPSCEAADNAPIKVNIRLNSKIESYDLRKFQKFSELASQIAANKAVPAENIVLMFRDKIIHKSESPDSLGYISGLVIIAQIHDSMQLGAQNNDKEASNKPKEGQIEIKIQNAARKKPFITYIGKTDKLKRVACECAEEFKCDITKIRLEFDGEMVEYEDTPDDLDLEGGEILDLFILKS